LKRADDFTLTFGKYKGLTLGEVSESTEGLRYLDWLVGWIEADGDRRANLGPLMAALREYLARPEVSRRVEEAIEGSWESRPKDPEPRKWWEK
jgi:hypothetical protein